LPFTIRNQTATADNGTEMYLLTENSSSEAAMPANSDMTLVRFTSTSSAIIRKVTRSPNSSRIRSESPLPVTAPMREHISCAMISATVMGSSVHNGR